MSLPRASVKPGEHAYDCRVVLYDERFAMGSLDITNFCQAVRKEPGSPVVVIELVANNGPEQLQRGFDIDVNAGRNEIVSA